MNILFAVPLLLLFAPAPKEEDPVKAELKALEGKWEAVTVEERGKPVPDKEVSKMTAIFDGDKLTIYLDGKATKKYQITIDPSTKPKTMDLKDAAGAEKSKEAHGIYKLERDELIMCFGEVGDRPADFKSGEKRALVVVKRPKR